MEALKDLILNPEEFKKNLSDRHKHVSREFQDYGYRLAVKLNDMRHKALYMKLAKEKPRVLLEKAFSFAVDYPTKDTNKGRLFMWKLKELEKELLAKASDK